MLEPFTVVGIDPGACCGIVAVKFTQRWVEGKGRQLVPVILGARTVISSGMMTDPTTPAIAIADCAVLLAGMYQAEIIGIEVPMLTGGRRLKRVATYGSQMRTIGVVVGRLGAHQLEVISVEPRAVKKTFTGDVLASKRQMMDTLKLIDGYAKCRDTSQARLEAKADATAIAITAGRARMKQEVGT